MLKTVPQISRVTDFDYKTAIQIFGEEFENDSKVYLWRPAKEIDKNALFGEVPMLPPEDARVFTIDNYLKQVIYVNSNNRTGGGVQILWVENSVGFSKPYITNRPKIFNQSLTVATAGDVFTLYGDNYGTDMRAKTGLFVNCETGESHLLKCIYQSGSYEYDREKFVTEFLLPEDLKAGEYKVYINSGTGGNLGWSEPTSLTVKEQDNSATNYFRMQWNDTSGRRRFIPEDVKIITLKPSDELFCDMADKIQEAIDSLTQGGIVRLSQGVYEIGRTVELKSGVVLLGDGENLTVIKASSTRGITQDWSNIEYAKLGEGEKGFANDWRDLHAKYNHCALLKLTDNSGVKSIGFQLGNGANIGILLASSSQAPITDAFVNCCTVDSMYHNSFEDKGFGNTTTGLMCVSNSENAVVYKSTFKAQMAVTFLPAHNCHLKFINNFVECIPYQANEPIFCGMYNGVIMANTFANGRRSLMCQSGFEGNFVYQNRSRGVARSGNALEVYMSEYGDTVWMGKPDAIGEDYIAVSEPINPTLHGHKDYNRYNKAYPLYAMIMDGRGFGQYRKVKEYKDGRFYFEKPFEVMPDETTIFSVCCSTAYNIWLDNNSEFSNGHSQFIWNCGHENIISGHEINMAAGIQLFANYGENNKQRCFCCFNKVERCQVRGSGKGMYLRSYSWFGEIAHDDFYTRTYGNFGNVIRHNAFSGSEGLQYVKNQNEWRESPFDAGVAISGAYNMTECNRIAGYHNGTHLIRNCEGNYFAKNIYYGTPKRFAGFSVEIGPDKE